MFVILQKKYFGLLSIIVLLCLTSQAQIGQVDTLFYQGVGIDYKCTGGLVLPDSSIIVTGKFKYVNEVSINGIAKLHPDGTIDNSFDVGSGADNFVNVVVRQPDGKLIIGGEFVKFDGATVNRIARLNPDGSRDLTFNSGTGFNGAIYALYLQADGKILVGGSFTSFNGTGIKRIARLNQDGNIDNSFTTGAGCDNAVFSVDQQSDGKIIIAGSFNNYAGVARPKLVRIENDGSIDLSFQIDSLGPDNTVTGTAMSVNNTILVAGFFTDYGGHPCGRMLRLNADGSEDTTFLSGIGFNDYINEMFIQPDGKILVDGNFTKYNGNNIQRVARLNINGSLDTTFYPTDAPNQRCNALFLDQSNRIYIGGFFTKCGPYSRLRIARLQTDGSLDHSFFGNSKLNGAVLASAFQSDNKTIIAGQFTLYNDITVNRIARLDVNGNLDNSFNSGLGANNIIRAITILPNNKILIAGDFTSYNGTPANRIALLNTDGTPDASFNIGSGANNKIYALSSDASGKIYIGGAFTKFNGITKSRIARLNPDGSLDNSFAIGSGFNNIVYSITLPSTGKILAGGAFTSYAGQPASRLIRLNTDGTRDNSFSGSANNAVYTITSQADGRLIIGGSFALYNGMSAKRIARLYPDGAIDSTFNCSVNNGVVYHLCMVNNWVAAVGSFTNVNGTTQNRITFLNPTGSVNTTQCLAANGTNNTVNSISFNRDSRKIFIGGSFESVQSHLSPDFAKLAGTNIGLNAVLNIPCPGLTIPLQYDKWVDFNTGNTFFAELSDAQGKFDSILNIGVVTSTQSGSGVIPISVPYGIFPGSNYKLRIVSTDPVDTSVISNVFSIQIPPAPTVTYSGSTTLCMGESLALSTNPGMAYVWSNGDTSQSTQATNSGYYRVSVTDNNNCTSTSAPVMVMVNPVPDSLIHVSSASLCNGGSVQIEAAPGYLYQWNTGSTGSSIVVNQSGNYAVTISNVYGCKSDSTVAVDLSAFYNDLIEVEGNSTFCPGNNVTLKATLPNYTYQWNNLATTQGIVVASSKVYSVTISDGNCSMSASAPVTVYPKPSLNITPGAQATFCQGGDVTLSASPGLDYQWSTGQTSQSITVNTPGKYFASLVDPNTGCTFISDTVQVTAQNCSGINDPAQTMLKVYPNPAKNQINVLNSNAVLGSVAVFDLVGHKVISIENLSASNIASINISELAAGPYFIQTGGQMLRFVKSE